MTNINSKEDVIMKCEFCNLSENDRKYFLYQNDYWDVYLADKQNYIGRCIIVCRRHCRDISDLTDHEWIAFKNLAAQLENIIRGSVGADLFNLACLMNDEYKKEKPNPHLHFHLIPRYSKLIKIGDKQFEDKEWSHHYNNKAPVLLENEEIEKFFIVLKKSSILSCAKIKAVHCELLF